MSDPNAGEEIGTTGELARLIREELGKVVVGQREVINQLLATLLAGGHALVEGVPGLGKTLIVKALAQAIGGSFSRIQFTPDLMPADITGHAMYDESSRQFRIRRGPVFANFLLADEINRAPAKTQAALLEVMQERQVTIEGQSLTLPPPFMTLGTQNPVELEGTYPLPEAQLDRFLVKVLIGYPTESEEIGLIRQVTGNSVGDVLDVSPIVEIVDPATVEKMQQQVSTVTLDDAVLGYAVRIVRELRDWPGVAIGAGPRGGIALARTARAFALLAGRDFVVPDDVKTMTGPCLRHRIVLAPELELEGRSTDSVLEAVLEQVQAPRR